MSVSDYLLISTIMLSFVNAIFAVSMKRDIENLKTQRYIQQNENEFFHCTIDTFAKEFSCFSDKIDSINTKNERNAEALQAFYESIREFKKSMDSVSDSLDEMKEKFEPEKNVMDGISNLFFFSPKTSYTMREEK